MKNEIVFNLLIAQLSNNNRANALAVQIDDAVRVIIPEHILNGVHEIQRARTGEVLGNASFTRRKIDLAVSMYAIQNAGVQGLRRSASIAVGQEVMLLGHHAIYDNWQRPFEIHARVLSAEEIALKIPQESMHLAEERIVVQSIDGSRMYPGMSGTAAINEDGELIGMLTSSPGNDPSIVALEPLLLRTEEK